MALTLVPGAAHAGSSPPRAASSPPLVWSKPAQVARPPWAFRISIDSVSCPAASLCVAGDQTGGILTSTNPAGGFRAWKQIRLRRPADLNPADEYPADVYAVACPTGKFCAALAGNKYPGQKAAIFTSTRPRGTASAWTSSRSGVMVDALALACPSAKLCVATAQGRIKTSTNPASGKSATWRAIKLDGPNEITAISCPRTTPCVAVDNSGNVLTPNRAARQPEGAEGGQSVSSAPFRPAALAVPP
jgi:hypothetical protein